MRTSHHAPVRTPFDFLEALAGPVPFRAASRRQAAAFAWRRFLYRVVGLR